MKLGDFGYLNSYLRWIPGGGIPTVMIRLIGDVVAKILVSKNSYTEVDELRRIYSNAQYNIHR